MKKKFFTLSILSLLLAFNANARDLRKDPEIVSYINKFRDIDRSGKGYITEKIYLKYYDNQWKYLDETKGGYITKDDFVANCRNQDRCDPTLRERLFEQLDLNNDGKLTKKEYQLKKQLEFAMMDKDGTGKVTESQFIEGIENMKYQYKFNDKAPEARIKYQNNR